MNTKVKLLSLLCLLGVGLIFFTAFPYNIEEAVDQHFRIVVEWDTEMTASVRYLRLPKKSYANAIAEIGFTDPLETYEAIENGGVVVVTRLKSGFSNKRILHKYIVFELTNQDGNVQMIPVAMTPDILENRWINLDSKFAAG